MWPLVNTLLGGILISLAVRTFAPAIGLWWRSFAAAGASTLGTFAVLWLALTLQPPDSFLGLLVVPVWLIQLLTGPIDDLGPDHMIAAGVILASPLSWLSVGLLVRDERGGALGAGGSLLVALLYSLLAALLAALLL